MFQGEFDANGHWKAFRRLAGAVVVVVVGAGGAVVGVGAALVGVVAAGAAIGETTGAGGWVTAGADAGASEQDVAASSEAATATRPRVRGCRQPARGGLMGAAALSSRWPFPVVRMPEISTLRARPEEKSHGEWSHRRESREMA